jgi:hypothetical protein
VATPEGKFSSNDGAFGRRDAKSAENAGEYVYTERELREEFYSSLLRVRS